MCSVLGLETMLEAPRDLYAKCRAYKDSRIAREQGIYPYFRCIDATEGNHVICEGKPRIMIGSNNYLGLAQDPRVIEAAADAAKKYGAGCTGSRLLNGTIRLHQELEEALAEFLEREAVLLFSTGFFANQGALSALTEEGDVILCDRENHASIIDGCQMAPARMIPFRHNSPESLRNRLSRAPASAGRLVVLDGVFSMSGDIADLPPMVAAAKEFHARTYVDEAHSLGVVGRGGRGVTHHFGLNDEVDILMGTFSKSLGSMGGFIAGSREMIEFLKHKARCFIFTASLAPAVAGGVLKALQIMQSEPDRIARLWENTRKMHEGFKSIGFNIGTTQTPIVPILIGSEAKAFLFSQRLYEEGIFAIPAIYPAVRHGEAIVRTSYMATHTDEDLDLILGTFERLARELGAFEDPAYTDGPRRRNVYDFTLQHKDGVETVRDHSGDASSEGPELRSAISK